MAVPRLPPAQVTRIDTAGLTVQEIQEQVQSRAEEMDTMQASFFPAYFSLVLSMPAAGLLVGPGQAEEMGALQARAGALCFFPAAL